MDLTALNNTAITMIDGTATTLGQWGGQVRLIVNVASRCGLSPQYAQLEELQEYYGPKGFTVLGCPQTSSSKSCPRRKRSLTTAPRIGV